VVGRLAVPTRSSDISVEEFEVSSRGSVRVRHFGFTRWQNADLVPDWPLRRFWPPDWRCLPLPDHLDDEIDAFRRGQSELASDGDGLLRKPR
jgi:hypothetical protein